MSAIITEKFRQHNANQFHESFSETAKNVYYLFLGKATGFTSATTGGSDSSPPTPGDNPQDEFRAWDSMLAAKNIGTSDIQFAVPRRNWSNGSTFDNVCFSKLGYWLNQKPPAFLAKSNQKYLEGEFER